MKIVDEEVILLSMTPDPIFLIERCGRVCYKSEAKLECIDTQCQGGKVRFHLSNEARVCPLCFERASKFIAKLVERGHEAVLEHASATVLIITDRGITHEIVRHRLAAYCQESTRYCKYGDEICVIKPPVEMTDKQLATWEQSMWQAEFAYLSMLETGMSPQFARSVLPTCLKTEIAITANMREWRHILRLRLSEAAHPQIRTLMGSLLRMFKQTIVAPCFGDFP
jgi:thymidylate synthase (FAD)